MTSGNKTYPSNLSTEQTKHFDTDIKTIAASYHEQWINGNLLAGRNSVMNDQNENLMVNYDKLSPSAREGVDQNVRMICTAIVSCAEQLQFFSTKSEQGQHSDQHSKQVQHA